MRSAAPRNALQTDLPFQLVDPGGTGAVIRQAKLRLQLPPRQAVRVPGKLALDVVSELVVGHDGARKREHFGPPPEKKGAESAIRHCVQITRAVAIPAATT